MKKGGREVKEKRVTSLLGEEEGEGETGDDLSQVSQEMRSLTKESTGSTLVNSTNLSSFSSSLLPSITLSVVWFDQFCGITPTTRQGYMMRNWECSPWSCKYPW